MCTIRHENCTQKKPAIIEENENYKSRGKTSRADVDAFNTESVRTLAPTAA
jgi:hypothetical protein